MNRSTRTGIRRNRFSLAIAISLGLSAVLTACTSGQVGVQPATNVVNPANSTLDVAVGIATLQTSGAPVIGLNVVETFRQNNGLSGSLLNTPKITGPYNFVGEQVNGGNANYISGTPPGGNCNATTFGCTGGAFGYGIAPDNLIGSTQSFAQFSQPLLSQRNNLNTLLYYGGPPAWPQTTNGTYPTGFVGFSPGFLTFDAAPVLGDYNLTLRIPIGLTGFVTVSKVAHLTSLTPLPALIALQPFADPANPGGLKIVVNVPSGLSEEWVYVSDFGQCYPQTTLGTSQAFFTIRTTQAGMQELTLPPDLGPTTNSVPTHTICTAADNQQATGNPNATGDRYSIYAAGFDYPAYAAAYPQSSSVSPVISGANGQADVSLSSVQQFTYGTEPTPSPSP
jgi:hypothetical protein